MTRGGEVTTGSLVKLQLADPSVPWPARGGAEKTLCDRLGWIRQQIPTVCDGRPCTIPAACRGELAVNRMLGPDEGFAISLRASGFRISFNGGVFARCLDAMIAAELMMTVCSWNNVQRAGYNQVQRKSLKEIIEAAERRGEIMLDRVYPR